MEKAYIIANIVTMELKKKRSKMSDHLIDEIADDLNAQNGIPRRVGSQPVDWIDFLMTIALCGSAALVALGIKTFYIWMGK